MKNCVRLFTYRHGILSEMNTLGYEPEDYDQIPMKMRKRNRRKNRKSSFKMDGSMDKPTVELFKTPPIKRQPTPYHLPSPKTTLATKNFKAQVLFSSDAGNFIESPRTRKKKNCLNSSDVNPKSSTKTSQKRKKESCNDSTSCKGSTKSSPKSKKVFSFVSDCGGFVNPENNKKATNFLGLPKPANKSMKRQSTPYYLVNKKLKRSSCKSHGLVSISSQNSLTTRESNDCNILQYLLPSSSELLKSNENVTPTKHKHPKKSKRSSSTNQKNVSERDLFMETGELICNNDKYESVLSNRSCFLTTEESDSELSDDLDLNTTSDHDQTIIYEDMSFIRYGKINDSFEEDKEYPGSEDVNGVKANISCNLEVENDEISILTDIEDDNDKDFKREVTAEAEYFYVENKLLIVLQNNSVLYFKGIMSVEVLQGAAEVLGYTLSTTSGNVEISSPRGSSLLYLKTIPACVSLPVGQDLSDLVSLLGIVDEDVDRFYHSVKLNSTVVLCREIIKNKFLFLEKHISQQIFPQLGPAKLRCEFQNKIGLENILKISAEWDSLVDSVDPRSKVFICGGKSVGKSTMLRYMLNKLLSKYSEILVVDLDPGQPEFTVSGCVSATVVSEPIFGPNYTHLKKPVRCFFVPNINVSYEPDSYLAVVQELVLSCADLPKIPTIINYMGFTRGLGLEIFSAVVAYVQPTSIIEIKSSSGQRNFKKCLTYQLICDRAKLLTKKICSVQEFQIYKIQSMADENQGWHLQPRQIREMCILTYLGTMIPPDTLSLTDTRIPTFVIDISLVRIMCNGETVNPDVINANLVALCSSHSSSTLYTCYGWGVVRGVDFFTNQLFLLTPVSTEELQLVDHLILGSVSLPPSLYMTPDNNRSLVPFVSEGVLVSLGQIPKRTYLSRFKLK